MNNNEPTTDQIANAISTVAEAVIKLHEKELITEDNVALANEVLATLLNKGKECIEKCMNCDCNNSGQGQENQNGNNNNNQDFVGSAWENLGNQFGFSENYCDNLALLQGMNSETLRDLAKSMLYIQYMNPSTGEVSGEYVNTLANLENEANMSGNYQSYLLDYLTEILNSQTGGNPSDCMPSDVEKK